MINLFPRIAGSVSGVKRLTKKLSALPAALLGPLLVNRIERLLLRRTLNRFITKTDPTGRKWKPWKPGTAERRARKEMSSTFVSTPFGIAHRGILVLSGSLANSIRVQRTGFRRPGVAISTGGGFRIGSNHRYARTHQMGDSSRNIPARKFLGTSKADATAAERVVLRLARRLGIRG